MTGVGTGIGSPIGDDNSVLPLPSHSVVNHLATSAIRNGVLAVATTTRYKAKVGHYRGNGYDDAEHGIYSTYPPSITDPHIPKTPPKNQKA
jgi:5'-AMP-activated protein kinase beta subunit, interaction domain